MFCAVTKNIPPRRRKLRQICGEGQSETRKAGNNEDHYVEGRNLYTQIYQHGTEG